MNRAFTLVELSIVLVILGLLVGGVLAGQSLIRAAELRAASTEIDQYRTALYAFKDKYFALPGDMRNATDYWGAEPIDNCPGGPTTPSTTTATCNGNGDLIIRWDAPAGYGGESHRFWQHLANAQLIAGSYTGTHAEGSCNGDGSCNVKLGSNAPKSRIANAGYSASSLNTIEPGHNYFFPGNYGVTLYLGAVMSYTSWPALKTEEAYSIDTKVDDGKPGMGRVRSWNPVTGISPLCASSADSAIAVYQLNEPTIACSLVIMTGL